MDWTFRAPWWLPGGNLQTLWAALVARSHNGDEPRFRRERWTTPDGDFVDVDHAEQTHGEFAGSIEGSEGQGEKLQPESRHDQHEQAVQGENQPQHGIEQSNTLFATHLKGL